MSFGKDRKTIYNSKSTDRPKSCEGSDQSRQEWRKSSMSNEMLECKNGDRDDNLNFIQEEIAPG